MVLGTAGYRCHAFTHAESSVGAVLADTFDGLIVCGAPHDPLLREVLRTLRERPTPVIAMISPSADADVIATLDEGADDCLGEPFHPGLLVARLRAVLRRCAVPAQTDRSLSRFDRYCFDPARHLVTFDEKTRALTPKEMTLALLLFRNVGRELSRRYLIEGVWMRESQSTSRSLDTHVSRIRRKLELTPDNGYQLAAIYSHGYRLDRFACQARTAPTPPAWHATPADAQADSLTGALTSP